MKRIILLFCLLLSSNTVKLNIINRATQTSKKTISITNTTEDPIQINFSYGMYRIKTIENIKNKLDPLKKERPMHLSAYDIRLEPRGKVVLPANQNQLTTLKRIMAQTRNLNKGCNKPPQTNGKKMPTKYIHEAVSLGIRGLIPNNNDQQFEIATEEHLSIRATNTHDLHFRIKKKRR